MADPDLLIGSVPTLSAAFHTTIRSDLYLRMKTRKRYWGGAWDMTFFLDDVDFGTGALDEYFNTWLMTQIATYTEGLISWRGVVWEMNRIKDGKRQRRTMDEVWNAIKCVYTTPGGTEQLETSWQEDDNSIARYLRRELIIYKDNVAQTQAKAAATSVLMTTYDAWAQSTDFNTNSADGLEVTVFGMGRLFNNLFCTVTTPVEFVDVDAFVQDIWDTDLSPFLSFLVFGGIDTNAYEVQREQREPVRCGDLIDSLARGGDNSVPYRWYVGNDLQFRFEKFDATPVLEWRGRKLGGIYKINGPRVTWNAEPGVMRDITLPEVPALPGSFLQQRNHELIEQFSMWQGQEQPQPELETPTEEQLLADAARYQQMITDGNYDRLYTPDSTLGGRQ